MSAAVSTLGLTPARRQGAPFVSAEIRLRDRVATLEEENRQLREMVVTPTGAYGMLRLSPQQEVVFSCLMREGVVSRDRLFAVLDVHKPAAEPRSRKAMDVLMFRIRSRLSDIGVDVTSVYRRGFCITPADKAKVHAAIGAAAPASQPVGGER